MISDNKELLIEGLKELDIETNPEQVEKLLKYSELILKWNKTYNLTAIRENKDVVIKHILDSLAVCKILEKIASEGNKKVLDVGCGAGLPSLPCSVFSPNLYFTLVDSVGKKIAFVMQVVTLLSLKHVSPKHERIESELTENKYSVITSRAFTSLVNFVNLTERLLEKNGRWLALKAKLTEEEKSEIPSNIEIEAIEKLTIPFLDETRVLVIMKRKEDK